MRRKLLFLLGIMAVIAAAGALIINIFSTKTNTNTVSSNDKLQVVTTFYPIYMIGLNLAAQSEGIEVKSLTDLNTGCLHDYQLTTEDMKLISNADVLVINGGGMEGFLEDVIANYPDLSIIDASEGIPMLKEDADKSRGGYNAHVWLDPQLYIKQIENVRDGLINYVNSTKSYTEISNSVLENEITQNAQVYLNEVQKLDTEIKDNLQNLTENSDHVGKAVIFHDSFAYLAKRAGIAVTFTVPLDSDTSLSAGDIATIIDAVKKDDIKYLFTEEQFSDSIAKQIEAETDAKLYIIDSAVTGKGDIDSYIKAMQNNLDVIKKALQQ